MTVQREALGAANVYSIQVGEKKTSEVYKGIPFWRSEQQMT